MGNTNIENTIQLGYGSNKPKVNHSFTAVSSRFYKGEFQSNNDKELIGAVNFITLNTMSTKTKRAAVWLPENIGDSATFRFDLWNHLPWSLRIRGYKGDLLVNELLTSNSSTKVVSEEAFYNLLVK